MRVSLTNHKSIYPTAFHVQLPAVVTVDSHAPSSWVKIIFLATAASHHRDSKPVSILIRYAWKPSLRPRSNYVLYYCQSVYWASPSKDVISTKYTYEDMKPWADMVTEGGSTQTSNGRSFNMAVGKHFFRASHKQLYLILYKVTVYSL